MLDQNTDRMWYVIGAVIIGAAIILILNGTMPQLFASIADTFEEKTQHVTEVTDGIRPMTRVETFPLHWDDLRTHRATLIDYDEETETLTLDINPRVEGEKYWIWSRGLTVKEGRVTLPWGGRMTLSYDVFVPEGLTGFVARTEVNNALIDPVEKDWTINDHDEFMERLFTINGKQYGDADELPLKDGQWNTVTFSYKNNDPMNKTQSALYDTSRFGITNHTGEVLQVKMRNIEWSVTEE